MLDLISIIEKTLLFISDVRAGFYALPWPSIIYWWQVVALLLSAAFIAGIAYAAGKAYGIMRQEEVSILPEMGKKLPPEKIDSRWADVKKRLASDNSSDWKFAILEADGILDEIMKKIGYAGETLGERLMKIEPSDFDSLQEIWAAHKVRNRIAHEAATFRISKEEAAAAIANYEKGLKELEYIS